MASIDRLGWATSITGQVHGLKIGIRVSDPAALSLVRGCLPHGFVEAPIEAPIEVVDRLYSFILGGADPAKPEIRRFHLVYVGAQRFARALAVDGPLAELTTDLRRYVAEHAQGVVFVHAGVVGWQGRAIVLPGQSFAGKSTLVAELLKQGATYYSDEYAVIDDEGRVHPYPKRLSLRQEQGPPRELDAETLGATVGNTALPIGAVMALHYEPGATFGPRALSTGETALALLANTVAVRREPGVALRTLARAVAPAAGFAGPRGEAEVTVPLLLLLSSSTNRWRLSQEKAVCAP